MQYRARIVAEVFCAQVYKIPDLKTAPKPKAPRLASVSVAVADARAAKTAAEGLAHQGAALGSGLALSRDLANLPPNVCTPTYLGTRAQSWPRNSPASRPRYWTRAAIKALKMGAFLAVTQGSDQPPRLIVCEYHGAQRRGADLPDRQGHHLRFRRHLPERPAGHGRNEVRHERRGRRPRARCAPSPN